MSHQVGHPVEQDLETMEKIQMRMKMIIMATKKEKKEIKGKVMKLLMKRRKMRMNNLREALLQRIWLMVKEKLKYIPVFQIHLDCYEDIFLMQQTSFYNILKMDIPGEKTPTLDATD